jgi:YVTN family beta-propeller protein
MRVLRALTLVALAAALADSVSAGTLVVLNKSDHEAALVDPGSHEVLARLPTGKGPHEVAVSPDGRLAYVTNYGAYAVFREGDQPKMDPGNSITVLDLRDRSVRATFDLGTYTKPHGIRVSDNGSRLWVTCEGARSVLELDARKGAVLDTWKTEQDVSHMLVATPDERKLYVANIGSGSVSVIDRRSGTVRNIPTGDGAEGIDITRDGREVWVVNRGADTISVIDTDDDTVIAGFASHGRMPIRIKFTPDGRQAWVSNARSNTVTVFSVTDREHRATIEVGAVPVGIQMTPDGRRAFVANTNDDRVTEINVGDHTVARAFTTGKEPDGMAWAP